MKIALITCLAFTYLLVQAQVEKQSQEESALSKSITQRRFNFKGFSTRINDDAEYENGNHILVGEIRVVEEKEKDRDANVNKIFNLKDHYDSSGIGIIILTDKNYTILKIAPSFIGEKVIYNSDNKQFTIGANFLDYIHVGDKSFSAWQPVIVKVNLELQGKAYFIKKPYSCILRDFIADRDKILVFTRSENNRIESNSFTDKGEKAEVIVVSTSKFHQDDSPWIQVLDVLANFHSPHNDIGEITLSDISKVDGSYYFTTSNLNQSKLENLNHLYQLKDDKLTERKSLSHYLSWNTEDDRNWININSFCVDSARNFFFSYPSRR